MGKWSDGAVTIISDMYAKRITDNVYNHREISKAMGYCSLGLVDCVTGIISLNER